MSVQNRLTVERRLFRKCWSLALVVMGFWAGTGLSQTPTVAPVMPDGNVLQAVATGSPSPGVVQAGCSSCGAAGSSSYGPGILGYGKYGGYGEVLDGGPGCSTCGDAGCGENGCVPGRPPCVTCDGHNRVGRFFCAARNALCCPDPCYEPRWTCGPNAALFVDPVRPVTQTRIRWDSGVNVTQPDRAEYFWAAIGGKGPALPETSVTYNELRYYQEAGTGLFSFFVDTPYRNLRGDVNGGAGGFGDMVLGTKSMLVDSELFQFTFQLTTSIPMGVPSRGLGVGHVAMEPSIIYAWKLYPESYWQGQLGYVIPISGTPGFAGSVLRFNNSLNHVICQPLPDTVLVGSIEQMGYHFTSGSVTNANGVVEPANQMTYFSVGPGLRLCICDRLDIGFGMQFALTNQHLADQLYRTEFRFRF